eukprot:CAMPEP_0185741592 /NCGR_PEP_ID=MMETSP1171-20130828/39040_1 /TAXON_ID=374046 /ORGANISM="Helicotheca tamensis, Strain CCMP826" /LENGTH=169 /DNA_ID=CAMNT_0028413571 /DNA_START=51 /DNA_END=557 /DNA_ORIENTATION=-
MSFFRITAITEDLMNDITTNALCGRVRPAPEGMMDDTATNHSDGDNSMHIDRLFRSDAMARLRSANDNLDATQHFRISKKPRIAATVCSSGNGQGVATVVVESMNLATDDDDGWWQGTSVVTPNTSSAIFGYRSSSPNSEVTAVSLPVPSASDNMIPTTTAETTHTMTW